MKKYIKDLIILVLQMFMFYIFPMFAGPTDVIGMVVLIILATLLLSFLLGIISGNSVKFLYPVLIAAAFVPSVFIYYNATALIHSLWYLFISGIGVFLGSFIRFCFRK